MSVPKELWYPMSRSGTMSIWRMVSVLSLILIVATGASASSHQIIVKCTYGADINRIAAAYGGTVEDDIPGSSRRLLSASFLPSSISKYVVCGELSLKL